MAIKDKDTYIRDEPHAGKSSIEVTDVTRFFGLESLQNSEVLVGLRHSLCLRALRECRLCELVAIAAPNRRSKLR